MIFLLASLVFVLDRITKIIAISAMYYGQSVKVLPGVFHITLVFNSGTAFGLMKGQNAILAVITAIAVVLIVVYVVTYKHLGLAVSVALGLILGGALGNLLDRIKFGYVVDLLDFRVWPVFNIADSAITIGMSILVIILCTRSS